MYGCESWTVKKAEGRRIDAFELWCWRRLLRVPWTARKSNKYIMKEISPGIYLERMMLKLKLQYFGHLMQSVDSLEKTLILGGIGGKRRRGWQRMRWLDGITDSMDMSWWWTGRPGVLGFMGSQRVGHDWATDLIWSEHCFLINLFLIEVELKFNVAFNYTRWERVQQPLVLLIFSLHFLVKQDAYISQLLALITATRGLWAALPSVNKYTHHTILG